MPINRALYDRAHETSSVEYAQGGLRAACSTRAACVAFWNDVDVVLTPTLAKLPVPIGWIFEPDDPWEQFERGGWMTPFTPLVNVTGQPAASVPFGVVDGLPVGVQLIGPPAGEAVLFRLAAQLEEARPWARAPSRREVCPKGQQGERLGTCRSPKPPGTSSSTRRPSRSSRSSSGRSS